MLIRSDSLAHLNEAGRDAITTYGVTTVLDLRSKGETFNDPSPFADGAAAAVRYVHRELIDDANMTNIGDSQSMLDRYLFVINKRAHAFREILDVIAETEGTVIFHCFAGKDRTGLIAAMLLDLAGVGRDLIAADYGETDQQLARQYDGWIGMAAPEKVAAVRNELRCPPERILGVLDYLDEKWGGVEGYLEAAGMPAVGIERVASKLK